MTDHPEHPRAVDSPELAPAAPTGILNDMPATELQTTAPRGTGGSKRHSADRLHARAEKAIGLMMAGYSVKDICEKIPISRTALFRLKQNPTFQERLRVGRKEAFDSAVAALHHDAVIFARTLRDICIDPGSKDSARATAARAGLDSLWNAARLFDLEERIARLEQATGSESVE